MNYPYGSPQSYLSQQPMFPQPNGNVYLINNSLEVANVPAGAGITAALCTAENLLYLKTVQNGVPTFLAYKLTPYTETPKATTENKNDLETRINAIEQQVQKIANYLTNGGKRNNDESADAKPAPIANWD